MVKLGNKYIQWVEKYLPSPFIIALLLSGVTFLMALVYQFPDKGLFQAGLDTATYWYSGFWELLSFTMQMAMILLLGYIVAVSPAVKQLINAIADKANNTAQAAAIVCFTTLIASFLNWGLCVIFGAILARQLALRFQEKGKAINYGLLAAAGYSGMMAWHGGFSGSAPLKVAEANHFLVDKIGSIGISETLLSPMNIIVSLVLLILLPLLAYWVGKASPGKRLKVEKENAHEEKDNIIENAANGAESKPFISKLLAVILLLVAITYAIQQHQAGGNIIDLNFINFCLLSLGILLHKHLTSFFQAAQTGISSVTDVLIQFPFYAGIMGIMKYSGLVLLMSDFFVSISNELTFPLFSFISAAVVNFFVPSGGGQWAVQGPILIEAAKSLGIAPQKVIMALAYGDQITNMLQPFWALPLLGITGLKAKDILPYTFLFFVLGLVIFTISLLVF